ncbi:hypothetical protein PG996_004272 [Apiospora saccharicola]|uniref:Uncharacterized protein n=1 Tax=Apiospora saccharicola TaxID=335842 RepID=A0ABR1W3U1_9PEZI
MDWLNPYGDFVDGDLKRFHFDPDGKFEVHTVRIHINEKGTADYDHKTVASEQAYRSWINSVGQTYIVIEMLYPLTFGVMYGCTDEVIEFVLEYLDCFPRYAFHPLMLPMMFAELERSRLLEALRRETSTLDQRILHMQTRLSSITIQDELVEKTGDGETMIQMDDETVLVKDGQSIVPKERRHVIHKKSKVQKDNETMLQKDCKATKGWLLVSELKNGVQSLITILGSMKGHSQEFQTNATEADGKPVGGRQLYTSITEKFQTRLGEIETELESEVRKCDGLLGGMSLATQMEWNFHTRRDAKANIIIAYASKMDSNQMRAISYMGMVFLPGTFLAEKKTLFSMTFFNWIPDESTKTVSPWIGLYCGSAVMLTLITWLLSRKYIADGEKVAKIEFRKQLASDDDSIV